MAETPLCLLIPGTLCDHRLFEPMLQAWSSLGVTQDYRVADLHDLTPQAKAWWDRELAHLPDQFDVMGFSLGVVLALELLGIDRERVRRLALVCGNASAGSELHRQRVAAQVSLWQSQGPTHVATQMLEQASPHTPLDSPVGRCVLGMAQGTPDSAFLAQGHINATRPDGLPRLASWRGPLLLVSGAQDPWCGADKQAMMLSVRPDAQWRELPQCGHYLPLQWPELLAELTATFFRASDLDKG